MFFPDNIFVSIFENMNFKQNPSYAIITKLPNEVLPNEVGRHGNAPTVPAVYEEIANTSY